MVKNRSSKKLAKTRLSVIIPAVIFVVISIVLILIFRIPESKVSTQSKSSSQAEGIEIKADNLFRSGKDLSVERLKLNDLPNSENIHQGFKIYENSLWVSGDGSLIEYDLKSGEVLRFSDPKKANFISDLAIVNDYLFAVHRIISGKEFIPDAVYKINLKNLKIDNIFTKKDGLLDQIRNFHEDGDYVWISTSDGLGRINSKTDKIDFFTNKSEINEEKDDYAEEDEKGFIQIYSPDKKLKHKINGRAFLWMSNVINHKRYFVTSASIDVLENKSNFPKTILEIGRNIDRSSPHQTNPDVKFYSSDGGIVFVVDPYYYKGGPGPETWGTMTISVLDTKTDKILTKLTTDTQYAWRRTIINGKTDFYMGWDRRPNKKILMNEEGQKIFEYDTDTNLITILDTNLAN